jgi:hypothetical protein
MLDAACDGASETDFAHARLASPCTAVWNCLSRVWADVELAYQWGLRSRQIYPGLGQMARHEWQHCVQSLHLRNPECFWLSEVSTTRASSLQGGATAPSMSVICGGVVFAA